MENIVLFQMWEPFRRSLIEGHCFYLEQAKQRLLSQFENIESEVDSARERWLENNKNRFDPERHDAGDFYERANDAGIEFYQLLSDMRDQTWLSVVAGMYHEWDKQLRKWISDEVRHWHRGENVNSRIWMVTFGDIVDLLESFGWGIRSTYYFQDLMACNLIVNVYKHGDGAAFKNLKASFSEYLPAIDPLWDGIEYRDYSYLKVDECQLERLSQAILGFWEDAPSQIIASEDISAPSWFEKALKKDNDMNGRKS